MSAAALVWPNGLCYVNEFWGGSRDGYLLVSDSNYDWGQGVPELMAWQRQNGAEIDVWYFGRDQSLKNSPLHELPLHVLKVDGPEDVLNYLRSRYLAVGTTLIYGQATPLASHKHAAEFVRQCQPIARTTTFLIFDRHKLTSKKQSWSHDQD